VSAAFDDPMPGVVTPAGVLAFWRAVGPARWFTRDAEIDGAILKRYGATYESGAAGELSDWEQTAEGALALVLVLDQFPRNMFRGEARAFATDSLARAAARSVLERGWDKPMTQPEQLFAYLPFEHSESLADQNLASELMKDFGEEQLRYALRHREIIERFGRFPHRNGILGRESTAAEIEFLKQPGSGF
jgi:uncharacterized protein (DUF924 family)